MNQYQIVLVMIIGIKNRNMGYYIKESGNSYLENEITVIEKLNVNSATSKELESLPGIGNKIAKDIISERIANGYFESFNDLTNRIKGLGKKSEKILNNVLEFNNPADEIGKIYNFEYDLASKLKIAISGHTKDNSEKRLLSLLDSLASVLARTPHPSSLDVQIRDDFNLTLSD